MTGEDFTAATGAEVPPLSEDVVLLWIDAGLWRVDALNCGLPVADLAARWVEDEWASWDSPSEVQVEALFADGERRSFLVVATTVTEFRGSEVRS